METPDTEWTDEVVEEFYLNFTDIEKQELDTPSWNHNGVTPYLVEQWIRTLLTARDTYWKERVRKEVETEIAEAVELTKREIKHRVERYFKGAYLSLKQQGGVHIHLEEIQEIIDDSTPPGFDLTPLQDKFNK